MEEKNNKRENLVKDSVTSYDKVNEESNELNNRINRLYGVSDKEEKKEVNYSPEELRDVRKKLMILFVIILLFGIGLIYLFIHPINLKKTTNKPTGSNDPTIEEPKEKDELPLGDISLTNDLVTKLNNMVTFSIFDFYYIDPFIIYQKDNLSINDIPNSIKFNILIKNNSFLEVLNKIDLSGYLNSCGADGLVIPKTEFESVVKKVFGTNITFNIKSNESYYLMSYNNKNIVMSIKNDEYTITCAENNKSNKITKYLQQELIKATKTEAGIELYQKIVFINESGVYKDPLFKTLITNDKTIQDNSYIKNGSTYKYTFVMDDNKNYYFDNIELVKEDK